MNSFASVFEMVDFFKDQFPLQQQHNRNRLTGFMNSLAHVFEMVDFLKDQFQLEQKLPIVT